MHMIRLLACVAAALVGAFPLFAEQLDHWVYESGTISDGVWTLSASVAKDKVSMTVGDPVTDGYPTDPAYPEELNFAKEIKDAGDPTKIYDLKTLNFSASSVKSGNGRPTTAKAWAGCIGRLVFPPTGSCKFTALAQGAFAWTTNLAQVVNFLPDEITSLGESAFRYSSVVQDVYLRGPSKINGAHTFGESKITSVTFGPDLTYLYGGNQYGKLGSFTSPNLTNVVFDAAMHDARLDGYDIFQNCPLAALPDLSGFNNLGARGVFRGCGLTQETLTIHAGVTNFHGSFMTGLSTTKLVFEGLPPDNVPGGSINGGTVLTTYVPEKYKTEWAKWTDGGKVVDEASTTWCQAAAGSKYYNFPLIYEAKAGDLGYWVYDADEAYDGGVGTVSDTNGVWKFKATVQGTQLTVGKWLKYPSTPSELDFTQPLSDKKGFPFVFLALNTYFGTEDSRHWVQGKGACLPTEASGSVSALKYPETVVSFGSQSFGCCSNLVSVVPMLGDWITSVGNGAFAKTGIKGDLRLMGLASTAMGTFQFCTNLTSVTFGPDLKTFYSDEDYNHGTFQGCTALTNVTFDAKMSGASLANNLQSYGYHFYGCTNLTGTLDLSGFKYVGYTHGVGGETSMTRAFAGTRYDNVIIASNVTEISRNAFLGMEALTNVTFLGAPPSTAAMSKDGFAIYGTLPQKVTTTIKKEYWTDWAPYVDGEKYSLRLRTWKPEYVDDSVDVRNRPVIVEGAESGLKIIIR